MKTARKKHTQSPQTVYLTICQNTEKKQQKIVSPILLTKMQKLRKTHREKNDNP